MSFQLPSPPSVRIKARDDPAMNWRQVQLNLCPCPVLRTQVPGYYPEQWNSADHASWMALFEFEPKEDNPFLLILHGLARAWTSDVQSGSLSLFGAQKRSSSSTEGFWLEMEESGDSEAEMSVRSLKRVLTWSESKEGGFEASFTLDTLLQWWKCGLDCHLLRPVLTKPWPEDFGTLMTTRPSSKPVVFSRRATMFYDPAMKVLYCCGPSLSSSSTAPNSTLGASVVNSNGQWTLIPETIVPLCTDLMQVRLNGSGSLECASLAALGSETVTIQYRLSESEPPKSLCISFAKGTEHFLAELNRISK